MNKTKSLYWLPAFCCFLGCQSGQVGGDCQPTQTSGCRNGVLYRLDSCGNIFEPIQNCSCGCQTDVACRNDCESDGGSPSDDGGMVSDQENSGTNLESDSGGGGDLTECGVGRNCPTGKMCATGSCVFPYTQRGKEHDYVADIVIGQPDFNSNIPGERTNFKGSGLGGVIVDRTVHPNRVYIYDGRNSRVLGYSSLGVCQAQPSQPCSCEADCASGSCQIQVGGKTGAKKADLLIGEPSFAHAACNQDGTFQHYPDAASPSSQTLCSMQPDEPSPLEGGSMAQLAVDAEGNLFVPDLFNNRVLKYNKPFDTDTVADEVWGQPDFQSRKRNQGNFQPGPTTLKLEHYSDCGAYRPSTAGAYIDSSGNLWVADIANSRVLRFPKSGATISKSADLVLGQPDFTSNNQGQGLDQMKCPGGVAVHADGRVFVTDSANDRVIVYRPPLSNGMSGELFAGNFRQPVGAEFDVPQASDPNSGGIWILDLSNYMLVLFNDATGAVKKVLFKDTYQPNGQCGGSGNCVSPLGRDTCNLCDARGSIGITSSGDILVGASSAMQDVNYYQHPIPTPSSQNPYPAMATFFYPPSGSNFYSNKGMLSARGITVTNSQLIVTDAYRIMYWNMPNGVSSLSDGKPADGVAGVLGFEDFIGDPAFDRIAADQGGKLWALRKGSIQRFALPLTHGAMPQAIINTDDFLFNGQPLGMTLEIRGIYADPAGRYLWLSLPYHDRAFRLKIPAGGSGQYVIEILIGGSSIPPERHEWHRPCPPESELCAPGSLTMDAHGDLLISDYNTENEGSGRLLRFASTLFPDAPGSLLTMDTTAASQIFQQVQGWQPIISANNTMVICGAAFTGRHGFPWVYLNMGNQTPPTLAEDGKFYDHITQGISGQFDAQGNLYLVDMNRGRVIVYLDPFGS